MGQKGSWVMEAYYLTLLTYLGENVFEKEQKTEAVAQWVTYLLCKHEGRS